MTNEQRSWVMRQVKSRDTKPELIVRRLVYRLGYRYRLYRKDLPCKPDLVFASRRKVIFINGCFWHGHDCLRGARMPATNVDYWERKLQRNVERDKSCYEKLRIQSWCSLVLWECELHDEKKLKSKIIKFLN